MSETLDKLKHCVYKIHFHLVVCTKYRKNCITPEMKVRLLEIFKDTLEKWESELIECNGEADHLHLLISTNPKVQPSKLVNNLKTVSSRLIRKEFNEYLNKVYGHKPMFWSRSYCLISCGGAPLTVIKQYIENQDKQD